MGPKWLTFLPQPPSQASHLGPAFGSGPVPGGNWRSGRRCWRWCHRPGARECLGLLIRGCTAEASDSSESRRERSLELRIGRPCWCRRPCYQLCMSRLLVLDKMMQFVFSTGQSHAPAPHWVILGRGTTSDGGQPITGDSRWAFHP